MNRFGNSNYKTKTLVKRLIKAEQKTEKRDERGGKGEIGQSHQVQELINFIIIRPSLPVFIALISLVD